VASSWILFFSYRDDARSNTHQKGINVKAPHLLNLGKRWTYVAHVLNNSPLWKTSRYPLQRRQGGHYGHSKCHHKDLKNPVLRV